MTSSTNTAYTQYLQGLLKQNNIQYQNEESFLKQAQGHHKQFVKGPLETNLQATLYGETLIRYSRQMLLKEIGYKGQLKICKAKVGVIGAGGIGCPVGLYLAAAGVGTLGIFEEDKVDLTNLHRQIAHTTSSIGKPKNQSLRNALHALNPNININSHSFITKQTLALLDEYDLIIDGSDNLLCRYLVNDYLVSKGRKLLSGACVGWEGQITCYGQNSPCYRCIWGNDQVSMGGCSTLGVIGTLPGVVGMVLATEAIKLLVTGTCSLEGELLTYNALTCTFQKSKLRQKQEECEACGKNKLSISQYNYDKFISCPTKPVLPDVPNIQWSQLIPIIKQDPSFTMIDVRPRAQFNIVNFKGSISIPYSQFISKKEEELAKIVEDKNKPIFVSCRIGVMSKKAADYLIKCGYTDVKNVVGGINQYSTLYDSTIVKL